MEYIHILFELSECSYNHSFEFFVRIIIQIILNGFITLRLVILEQTRYFACFFFLFIITLISALGYVCLKQFVGPLFCSDHFFFFQCRHEHCSGQE